MDNGFVNAVHPTTVADSIVSVKGLSFSYSQRRIQVLSGVTFELRKGDFCALVGRSGAGKSTLLNILAGYLMPDSGVILFKGEPLVGPAADRLPIYQEDGLWPWLRAWENVLLAELLQHGRGAVVRSRPLAEAQMRRIGLSPSTYEVYPKELSVGMKKRVELARFLLTATQLLLADEPFSSLDEVTRSDFHELMLSLWAEKSISVLFSTHDLHEALYLATRIMILSDTSPAEIVGVYANPFHGRRNAARDSVDQYYALFDELFAKMGGGPP